MRSVKTKLLWALAMLLLISSAPGAFADWHRGDPHKMHYPQLPDPEGWDICVVDQYIADDFMCAESGKITDIHIWFSVERDQLIDPEGLQAEISIWDDQGGMPGTRQWTWNGGGQVNFLTPYGSGQQGWACPSQGIIRPNDHLMFHQVNITEIPEPFVQTEGKTYWLVVRVLEPAQPKIGWKTSANDPPTGTVPIWGSHAWWSKNPDAGEAWQPVETGGLTNPQLHDMAFVITGEATTVTGACCEADTGLCFETDEADCRASGSTYLGDGVSCTPNPCMSTELGACCLPDGGCVETDITGCDIRGGIYKGDGTSCTDPWICSDRPTIQVGPWVVAQPWNNWFGPYKPLPVHVLADPCEFDFVEFSFSLDGQEWIPFGADNDGSQPKVTTLDDEEPPQDGDGWAAVLDPAMIPTLAEGTVVQVRARAFNVDSFFDIEYQIDFDPSPMDEVEVVTQIQDDTLWVDVNPDPRYPDDIQFVVVEVEPKEEEFQKPIPPLDQLNPSRAHGGGYHCAPTATAACLKYFEGEGDSDIAGGLSGDDLTDELAKKQGTNQGGLGTYFDEWVDGTRKWIAEHGDGYTVRAYRYFDWKTARDELERCQDVLLRLEWPNGFGHALTLSSIHNTPQSDGTIRIDLMDPYKGTISYGDLNPATGGLKNFEGASGNSGRFSHMIIICPKEEGPGGGGDPHPGPDPGPIPFPGLKPGKHWVRVTVVDPTNHAATLIDIVDIPEPREPEYGDAPEGALAYPSTCKIGSFPTCMNVGPAGFIRHYSTGMLFFGPLVDGEPEGNAGACPLFNPNTYDQDECFADNDAGLIMPPAYTIRNNALGNPSVVPCGSQTGSLGTVCKTAIWGKDIDIHVENRTNADAYVNVLVDWNKSGEWSGQSVCPPCLGSAVAMEHVLIDQRVPAGYSGPLSGTMALAPKSFTIGPNPGHVWTRFTVTPHRLAISGWPGDGEFSDGESEDYLLAVDPPMVFTTCNWNPGDPHKMHWAQEPDLEETGLDVAMPEWTSLADDFKCSETGYITDIHFWGSFADDCLPPGGPASLTFQIALYSDIPATPDSHSMPGDIVWGPHTFAPCDYSVRRMKDGPEGWYDPTTGDYMPLNHFQAYQYNICIDQDMAFLQRQGTIYWLEIKQVADTAGFEPEYEFGWKTTKLDLSWNDDAVYRTATGGWSDIIYPDGHPFHPESLNLAFVITGEGIPEPDKDWGDAPDPPYPTLSPAGASHVIDARTYLGATVDADPGGQPTAAADGDDLDAAVDDEDGVTFDTPWIPGQPAQITVNASIANAYISVWVDYAYNSWPEATDYVVQSVASIAGNNNIFSIPVPAGVTPGTRAYVRVRFTTMPQIGFGGPAPNGEVEDYVVVVEEPYEPKPPVPHLKWSQPPIEIDPIPGTTPTYCGWDEPSWLRMITEPPFELCPPRVADDFRCLGSMPVTSIHWWGSHYGWEDPAGVPTEFLPIGWRIHFYSNIPQGAGNNFSQPGQLLWTIKVDDVARVEVETVGRDEFGDFHPKDVCYQYTLYLDPDEYFWQNKYVTTSVAPDAVFWISIQAVYAANAEIAYPWGWKTRPWSWMDAGVRSVLDTSGQLPQCAWRPIRDPHCEENADLAFELDTDPDYIKWEQPFNGLRRWPHYEDEESMAWEVEPSPNKWEQLPDTTLPGLHAHDSTAGLTILADDWVCQGGDVTDLHWYGNYELDANRNEMRGRGIEFFHLSIHRIDGHACIPGAEVWSMDVPFAAISETDTGLTNSEGCKIYLYEYDLKDPYPQIQGNKYWLDISAKSLYPESPAIWRWQEAGRSSTPIECGAARRTSLTPWKTITWSDDRFSDMAFAITSDAGQPRLDIQRLVADDWPCTKRQPVTAAVWWGSYIGYQYRACECLTAPKPVKPDYFLLTIWTDVPADPTIPGSYSHPRRQVWKYKAYNYDEVLVGYDKHPHDVPGTNPYGREAVFRYSVRLPQEAWFHQKEDYEVFWFSAVAVYKQGTDPIYPWGWTNHEHMYNDAAVAGYIDSATGQWSWEPLKDQTGVIEDMSFILFTEPGCFPSSYSTYTDWLALGKPNCWCGTYGTPQWPYQCDGDADNMTQVIGWRVYSNDLVIMANSWQKTIGDPTLNPCADFDHKAQVIGWRVYSNDLVILANRWQVMGLPADCPRPE